jgi:hypothetical protein
MCWPAALPWKDKHIILRSLNPKNMKQLQEITAEPFIGQVEYIKYLMNPPIDAEVPHLTVEAFLSDVDINALEQCVAFFVNRHESLRTVFPLENGEVKQVILPFTKDRYPINYLDLSDEQEEFFAFRNRFYKEQLSTIADLACGPMVRFYVFKLKEGGYVLSVLIHHLISDAWSLKVIRKDLREIYTAFAMGKAPGLPVLTFQLKDYCREQNRRLLDNREYLSTYWKSKAGPFDWILDIESYYRAYARRNNDPAYRQKELKFSSREEFGITLNRKDASTYSVTIGKERMIRVRELAQRNCCSVSTVIYTSFFLLIYAYTGKNKPLLASLMANRTTPQHRGLIGCLLGSIYLTHTMADDLQVDELLKTTFNDIVEGSRNMIFSHELLEMEGEEMRTNCDMYLNYIFMKEPLDSINNLRVHILEKEICYAIDCMMYEYTNDLSIRWGYNTQLFTPELMEDLVKCHEDILDCITERQNATVKDVLDFVNEPQFI